jgi:hypothetical protein
MLFRSAEVVSVLAFVVVLLVAKHIPIINELPLAHLTGIVCFAFAIFLSLRIYNAELARIRAED